MSKSDSNSEKSNFLVRFFSYLINKLWLLLASGIILIAVVHILLGFFLPQIDRYRPEIISWIEDKYQVKVQANSISAQWSIHGPVLELTNLKIESLIPSDDSFEVGRISIYFDIITSLWNQRFSTEEIIIDKANIDFYLSESLGVKLILNNEKMIATAASNDFDFESLSSQVFDILFGQRKLRLSDLDIRLITANGQHFPYHFETVEIKRFDDIHQLTGNVKGESGERIAVVAEVFGDPNLATSKTKIYMQGKDLNVENIPWPENKSPLIPKAGVIGWELWGDWESGAWRTASASIELDGIDWSLDQYKESTSPKLNGANNKISSMLSWQQNNTNLGQFVIHDSYISSEQESSISLPDIQGEFKRTSADSASWNFAIENFQMRPLFNYIGQISNGKNELTKFFTNASPSMVIESLYFSLPKRLGLWQESELNLSFSSLSYLQWRNLPRANGLFGKLYWQESGGIASLEAENSSLELGDLFRHAIEVNSLNALVTWSQSNEAPMEFQLRDFNLHNNDLTLHAEAKLFYQDDEPLFSLYSELTDVNAGNKSLYLPVGIMEPDLVKYLDTSVKSGRFSIIKNAIRGNMDNFPFSNSDGYFAALGFLENAEYQYLPEWPTAKELNAKLLFVGNGMDITASHAKSYNNQLTFARALTKDFSIALPKLELELEINSIDNSVQNFLSETPLSTVTDALKELDLKGRTNSNLNLYVGLSEDDNSPVKLNGNLEFDTNFERLLTPVIAIDGLQGKVNFNQDSIAESSLTGSHQGNDLVIELGGSSEADKAPLWVTAKGELQTELLKDFIGRKPSQFLEGKALLETLVTFPSSNAKSKNIEVEFKSTMEGVTVLLPGEFGKTEEQLAPLSLNLSLGELSHGEINWNGMLGKWYWHDDQNDNKDPSDVSRIEGPSGKEEIDYGVYLKIDNRGKLAETFETNSLSGLDVIPPGINIDANLNRIDLEEWISFASKLNDELPSTELSTVKPNSLVSESDRKQNTRPIFVNKIALNAASIESKVTQFSNAKISLTKDLDRPWEINFDSPEAELYMILHSEAPWNINIEKSNIHIVEKQLSLESEKESILSSTQLLDMDIDCKDCKINGVDYGSIKSKVRTSATEVIFDGVISNNKKHQIAFSGVWGDFEGTDSILNSDQKSSNESTKINIDLITDDAGSLLKRWDIEAAIKDSPGRLIGTSYWKGAPWDFDYLKANAELELHLDKGYLSEISDGQGRLFSLFNLQSLVRKLTFDFKDVYKKGFFFDSIQGTFTLAKGVISTENVSIKGNVADVKLYGETDLLNETIDQIAVITPHLTSSLPVLAAWAVEPTTGILVWMINKIMEPAVEVATRIDYRIHGPFDEVDVVQVNSSRKKIKVEYETKLDEPTESDELIIDDELETGEETHSNLTATQNEPSPE